MSYVDHIQKRKPHTYPNISFIIPCYNDGDSIEATIKSIYTCYDKSKFQLIIINDHSRDNSKEVIQKLQSEYEFLFIDQEKNTGKSVALNNAAEQAIHEIIIFIDADSLLNKDALNDILQRLEHEKNVVAVTCPYRPSNKWLLPIMQQIEYNVARFTSGSYNYRSSVLTLRWWCIGIYKKNFIEAGKFSINAISEDMDLALKLRELWHRAQQSLYTIETGVPYTYRSRYKQKIRRSSGGMQCLIKHFKTWIKNPIFVIFTTIFQVSLIMGTFYLIKNAISFGDFIEFSITLFNITTFKNGMNILWLIYGDNAVANTTKGLAFSTISLPYVIPLVTSFSTIRKILYIIPYSIIYIPIHSTVRLIGSIYGIKKYYNLKDHPNKQAR